MTSLLTPATTAPDTAASRTPAKRSPWERRGRLLVRIAAIASAVAGLLTFVVAPLRGQFTGDFEDYGAYLEGGRAALRGTDLYTHFVHQAPNVALSGYDYPPIVAWLARPLATVSAHASMTAWLWLGLFCTVAGALVVAHTLLPERWPRTDLALVASMLYAPAAYNLWHGQMNPLIFLVLALALQAWVTGRQRTCGALIGVAAAIKLAPIVLVILLLRRRWWAGAVTALATSAGAFLAGVVALGAHTTVEFVRDVVPVLGRDDGWVYNQSWNGVINRLVGNGVLTVHSGGPLIRVATLLLALAGLAVAAWSVRPGVATPRPVLGATFGAGIAAMLLAGTITWYAHYVHLLIPLAAGAALLAGDRGLRDRLLEGAMSAVILAVVVLAPILIAAATMTRIVAASHTPWWWPLLQVTSLPALSAAFLLVALARTARRTGVA